jgi:hypothetical protein
MAEVHPVQTHAYRQGRAEVSTLVTKAAYEVYCALYGEQAALMTNGCRGGFSAGELVAFLYARSFPKDEWERRVDEAFHGMSNL